MTGLIYCSVILACRDVYAFGRARQWTAALARWCDAQPQLIAFTGACRVHRAEILQLARRLAATRSRRPARLRALPRRRSTRSRRRRPSTSAAEMHRLRGEFAAAEADYRRASRFGCEPQPGLALLRLAQGRRARRRRGNPPGAERATDRSRSRRARLLPGAGRDRAGRRRDRGGGRAPAASWSGPRRPSDAACRSDRRARPRRGPAGPGRRRGRARARCAARSRCGRRSRRPTRPRGRAGPDRARLRARSATRRGPRSSSPRRAAAFDEARRRTRPRPARRHRRPHRRRTATA